MSKSHKDIRIRPPRHADFMYSYKYSRNISRATPPRRGILAIFRRYSPIPLRGGVRPQTRGGRNLVSFHLLLISK